MSKIIFYKILTPFSVKTKIFMLKIIFYKIWTLKKRTNLRTNLQKINIFFTLFHKSIYNKNNLVIVFEISNKLTNINLRILTSNKSFCCLYFLACIRFFVLVFSIFFLGWFLSLVDFIPVDFVPRHNSGAGLSHMRQINDIGQVAFSNSSIAAMGLKTRRLTMHNRAMQSCSTRRKFNHTRNACGCGGTGNSWTVRN